MASIWDDLVDENTTISAECGACSWRARGKGENRVHEVMDEANEHSTLHPGVSVELDYAEGTDAPS